MKTEICKNCGHIHQGLMCCYPIKWTSNNIPEEICPCKELIK
ncbi:hypothetical protein LCGC14_1454680 [marine sediment metagenome]|uniref:Uncharacterized protein n=1 Tax=marine sediment metagenome TaxID=412755 RepID=A0A0F9JHI0_9ZZZZ